MARYSLTAIAALGSNGIIGDGIGMPWHIREDLAHFKQVTMDGVLVMGRRTYESLPGHLSGRTTIVLTRNHHWKPLPSNDCQVIAAAGLPQLSAILADRTDQTWWSAGGGEIYRMLWDYTTDLDLTLVDQAAAGSVSFPDIDPIAWHQTSRIDRTGFAFTTYTRVDQAASLALEALIENAG